MQTINSGYRSLALLLDLNSDRLFSALAIALALGFGAFLGSVVGG